MRRIAFSVFSAVWFIAGGSLLPLPAYADDTQNTSPIFDELLRTLRTEYLYELDLERCRGEIYALYVRAQADTGTRSRNSDTGGDEESTVRENGACLDKHTRYLSPRDAQLFIEDSRGAFGGIGAMLSFDKETQHVVISRVLPGEPAESSGVRKGDRVLGVESGGTLVRPKDPRHAVRLIRGEPGTDVIIVLERGGLPLAPLSIRRSVVRINPVSYTAYERKDGGQRFGYVRIFQFSRRAGGQLWDAMHALQGAGISRVVIDVRDNPGGSLSAVLEALYYFHTNLKVRLVSVKGKTSEKVYTVEHPFGDCIRRRSSYTFALEQCAIVIDPVTGQERPPGAYDHFKVVVLANAYSASASEIFAGVMKEWGRENQNFIVVGETTFGKGSVQGVEIFSDGSLLKYTIAEYLLGDRRIAVNGIGVSPTFEVRDTRGTGAQGREDTGTARDAQFQGALRVWGLRGEDFREIALPHQGATEQEETAPQKVIL